MQPPLNPPTFSSSLPPDTVDPELVALPAPPKRELRLTVLLLAITALLSLAMSFSLRHELLYAIANAPVNHVGDLRTADLGVLAGKTIEGAARVGAAGGIRYERPFVSGSFRLVPVAGRDDLFIETRVAEGAENARYVPPASFSGRVMRFDAVGPKYRGLRGALESVSHTSISPNAYLLVDGESPQTMRSAVVLAIVFVGFALWNLFAIAKLVRRVGDSR